MGPTALARAPRLRRVPMTVPFCPGEPVERPHQVPASHSHLGVLGFGRTYHSRRPRRTNTAPQQQRLVGDIGEASVSP